jgi:hypothetical protein
MTESLFFNGKRMKEDLSLKQLDYIVFSDGTHNEFMYYEQGIRFTKEILFLCQNYNFAKNATKSDDWQEWDIIEICPWENIISIDRYKQVKIIRSISHNQIISWLNNLEDIPLSFPIFRVNSRKKHVIFHIYLFIDVFTTQKEKLADTDRFVRPIMDFFKGILYEDDSQIIGLYPRIFNMNSQFTVLECRTEPMGLSYIENIPIGSLFPFAKNIRDYYVIRFKI